MRVRRHQNGLCAESGTEQRSAPGIWADYGSIPPDEKYDRMIELLEPLEIGDALRQDCRVDELDSFYTVLNRLVGSLVNFDELDYLAKRLDSFDDGEAAQFQGMAANWASQI